MKNPRETQKIGIASGKTPRYPGKTAFKRLRFRLLCIGIHFAFRFFVRSYRPEFIGIGNLKKAMSLHPEGSVNFAAWHQNACACSATIPYYLGSNIVPMLSRSKDGEYLAHLARSIGLESVRGSSSQGGKEAREEILTYIARGYHTANAVDGPRGPRNIIKPGIVDIARKSGAPILPVTAIGKNNWIFEKSWDRTRIPKPFTTIVVIFGEPIQVPPDIEGADFTDCMAQTTKALDQQEKMAMEALKRL